MGLSIKDVRSQGRGGLSSADILQTKGGVFRCGCPYFSVQKHWIFQNLWCVSMDKGEGVEPMRTFCGQGGWGSQFTRFMDYILSPMRDLRMIF